MLSSATETDFQELEGETEDLDEPEYEGSFPSLRRRFGVSSSTSQKHANGRRRQPPRSPRFESTLSESLGPAKVLGLSRSLQLEACKPLSLRIRVFKTRTIWTLILILTFLAILGAGHFYSSLLVLLLTSLVYGEVIALKRDTEKDKRLPLFYVLRWYWFVLTVYGTGYNWILPLADAFRLPQSKFLEVLVTHHLPITYFLGILGLIIFVLSLRRFSLRYQFSQFALLVLTSLLIVGQSTFQIANIHDGLIWFFISTSSVIVNDIFGYVFGFFFGRTRLLKLSPKKTVEGFLGASVVTLLWSVAATSVFSRFKVLVCPQTELKFRPFSMWSELDCEINPAFLVQEYHVLAPVARLSGWHILKLRPVTLHALVLGLFASFFAPFGGFLASAFKRTLRIKDFGVLIPGHGGITDRFDCQIIMGVLTSLYIRTFIFRQSSRPTVEQIALLIARLTPEDQVRLIRWVLKDASPAATMLLRR